MDYKKEDCKKLIEKWEKINERLLTHRISYSEIKNYNLMMTEELMKGECLDFLSSDKRKKLDELKIAWHFIRYINKDKGKDFCFPYYPPKDDGIDALSCRESDPKVILKMQITAADPELTAGLETPSLTEKGFPRGTFSKGISRVTNKSPLESFIEKAIKSPILKKSAKRNYAPEFKKDLIILLNGWYTFSDSEDHLIHRLNFIRNQGKKFFQNTGFKEIWLVYDDISYKLYPQLKSGI